MGIAETSHPRKHIRHWEWAFDDYLRDHFSRGEIRAQARFLRHPKFRNNLKPGSVSIVTSTKIRVYKT